MEPIEQEEHTGIRFSWNVWPVNRAESSRIEVPLSCLYTPLRKCTALQLVEYEPLRCRHSNSVLNPYCLVDFRSKTWTCPFTLQRNAFPQHYADNITEENLPAELMYPSIEYILPANPSGSGSFPVFLFVVDICIIESELEELKDSLQQALSLMPQNAHVGLITFGSMCYVHELGFSECPRSYVFRGTKEVSSQQLLLQLGLSSRNDPRGTGAGTGGRRFLIPITDCEYNLSTILEDLQRDCWPVAADSRPLKCTGVALSVAVSLLECCYNQQPGLVQLFVGGVCTVGPGQIVGTGLTEPIRNHVDLQKDNQNSRFVKKASKFYNDVATRAAASGHGIDIYACCLDQVGIYEMKICCEKTGGHIVMSDSFSMNVFKGSFRKVFELDDNGHSNHGYNARLEVLCSKEFQVCGAVGGCASTSKKGAQVSDTHVGKGGTCEWSVGVLDKSSTIAFYFEVTSSSSNSLPPGKQSFLQFQTLYYHPSGRRRLRVTTVSYRYAEPKIMDLAIGFDQEAAAVLVARLAVHKTETDETLDIVRWLDRKLIRLVSAFADYQKNDVNSFHLSVEFSIFPQFMYHLRRSHFLQTFNSSPDESAYYRTVLLQKNVMSSLVMIQPALLQYGFEEGPPQPVLLDAQSLKPNVILLLDSFFHVVIWHGELIHQWKEQRYQDLPEYENFRQLLQAPEDDAKAIIDDRFPVPKFVQCNAGGSQARFLLARVNPSTTHNSLNFGSNSVDGTAIVTDDVPLKVFMDHLIRLSVQA